MMTRRSIRAAIRSLSRARNRSRSSASGRAAYSPQTRRAVRRARRSAARGCAPRGGGQGVRASDQRPAGRGAPSRRTWRGCKAGLLTRKRVPPAPPAALTAPPGCARSGAPADGRRCRHEPAAPPHGPDRPSRAPWVGLGRTYTAVCSAVCTTCSPPQFDDSRDLGENAPGTTRARGMPPRIAPSAKVGQRAESPLTCRS